LKEFQILVLGLGFEKSLDYITAQNVPIVRVVDVSLADLAVGKLTTAV